VVLRNVISNQIKIGRDHTLAELSGLRDIDSLVDLIGVPDDVRLTLATQSDLGVVSEVLGIGWKFTEAHEANALDVGLLGKRGRSCCCHDLRTCFMGAEPGDIDSYREVIGIDRGVGESSMVRGAGIFTFLQVEFAGLGNDLGFVGIGTGGKPPVMSTASLGC